MGVQVSPILNPPCPLPPHPIPQGHPSAPALSNPSHALNLDWRSVSHMVIHMSQCYALKSSHPCLLPQSPGDCSIHLCLFCCFAYRVIVIDGSYLQHSLLQYLPGGNPLLPSLLLHLLIGILLCSYSFWTSLLVPVITFLTCTCLNQSDYSSVIMLCTQDLTWASVATRQVNLSEPQFPQ